MRILLFLLLLALPFASPGAARAQGAPVVVEFYTAQGCSACPPADDFFADLAEEPGVIALALHVTYWNWQGWVDAFGKPEHDDRQRGYAKAAKQRSLYTPQMIVQGADRLIGSDSDAVKAAIAAHAALPSAVELELKREGAVLTIRLAPTGLAAAGPSDVFLVSFLTSQTVSIAHGENAGHTIDYRNVVTDWRPVARWDGRTEWEFAVEAPQVENVAVIVQRERMGPVLTAARLD